MDLNVGNSIVIDVEADGPAPMLGSMVCFGVVLVNDPSKTFYGRTRPIVGSYVPDALAVSGFSREEHMQFEEPRDTMEDFAQWLSDHITGRPVMWSDNPAFDFMWMAYYTNKYLGRNPLGWSARRIGDLYCGTVRHLGKNRDWKQKHRGGIPHDHNPVNDALGNAHALSWIVEHYRLRGKL